MSASASSGLPVRLTVASSSSGVCSISGGSSASPATVSYVAAGSCVIDANQSGNGTYAAAAQKTQTLTVRLNPETITFGKAPSGPLVGGSGSVSASASSGLPVTLTVAAVFERGVLDFGWFVGLRRPRLCGRGELCDRRQPVRERYVRGGGAEDADAER